MQPEPESETSHQPEPESETSHQPEPESETSHQPEPESETSLQQEPESETSHQPEPESETSLQQEPVSLHSVKYFNASPNDCVEFITAEQLASRVENGEIDLSQAFVYYGEYGNEYPHSIHPYVSCINDNDDDLSKNDNTLDGSSNNNTTEEQFQADIEKSIYSNESRNRSIRLDESSPKIGSVLKKQLSRAKVKRCLKPSFSSPVKTASPANYRSRLRNKFKSPLSSTPNPSTTSKRPVAMSSAADYNDDDDDDEDVLYSLNIPSGSEDSELSDSDDEGQLTSNTSVNRKRETLSSKSSSEPSALHAVKQRRCLWKDGVFLEPETTFLGSDETTYDYSTPLQCYKYFMSDDIMEEIARQTTLYSVQTRPDKPVSITRKDIDKFIGILFHMSITRLPRTRMYWSPQSRIPCVADTMTVNKFEMLKRFLHFSDNEQIVEDRVGKIRPLVDHIRRKCSAIQMEENLSIDEQIVPFKGRSQLKQYNPRKPHKWGYKVFVLSGVTGFSYDFEIYTGKENNKPLEGEVDCGASGNVVIRLSRNIPKHINHKLYYDNYFTGLEVQLYLVKQGIWSLGTVRCNRLPQCNLLEDAILKKRGRGSFDEKVSSIDDVSFNAVRWFDNKAVNFLSTFIGTEPVTEVRRWSASESAFKMIKCPKIVTQYNKHMGGVDLLDSLLGLYRTRLRSKKWYHRIFFHFMDLTIVNAWLLYRRCNDKAMRLLDFKMSVAEALCRSGKCY